MQQSSLNKHRPLPEIKSPTEEPKPASKTENDDIDKTPATATAPFESSASAATENKPLKSTGPTKNAYKLKDLPLEEVIGEVETRINRLKTFESFSNSECSDDLRYLNASTRCGSNPEVSVLHTVLMVESLTPFLKVGSVS